MRTFFLFLLLFVFGSIDAQTISGIVREKGTGLPLPFANVFVNNTTQGRATDKEGRFSISGDFPDQIELVASFVGYLTEVKSITFGGKNQVEVFFELVFNESNLSEIELKARRDKTWERNLKKFEGVFLALPDDPYKPQIEILNPWVVDFEKIKVKNGLNYLKASAQEPLKIINYALGYEINYYLEDFRLLRNGFRFYGQVFYEPIGTLNIKNSLSWEEARHANYFGSLQHLNQSILLNTPDSTYFALFKTMPEPIDRIRSNDFSEELNKTIVPVSNDSIMRRPLGNGTFRIFIPTRMEVHHLGKRWTNDYYTDITHPISWIQAPEGFFDIDKNGTLLNPTQLVLSGYLGRRRVARSLPLDFKPSSNFLVREIQAEEKVSRPKLDRLREKVWLTTSKPYFYPGETAWIGGRMLYQETFLSDSLSRAVHVDILGANAEIVQSATFPIRHGKISGGLQLSQNLVPGNYILRAYTNWNLNFPETDQFIAPFVVMEQGFRPEIKFEDTEIFQDAIQVNVDFTVSDSLNYRAMNLRLDFLDEFENAIDGDFLLTISDSDEVVELKQETRLNQALKWLDTSLPENFESFLDKPVAYGISFRGKFTPNNKRQPLITPITIVRGDLEDYGQVLPDSSGNFWATGLFYQDTAQIAIAALNKKRSPFGFVEIEPLDKPNFPSDFPKLAYGKTPLSSEEYFYDLSGDYILLEEFVKEGPRSGETMADRNYGYGLPDREVNEEQLLNLSPEAIYGLLGISGTRIGNYNFGQTTSAPLLIIDGVQYPHLSGDEFLEILKSYSFAEFKSMKVYTFSAPVFGMAGYAGVLMIETRRGSRTSPEIETNFNSKGFQSFSIAGFTTFPEFPQVPPPDKYLMKKPTIYWEPEGTTTDGRFEVNLKIPYGVSHLRLKLEGISSDGEPFYKVLDLEL